MKKFFVVLLIILVGIQFIPVERRNPPVTRDIEPPENITVILRTSCYDCHSNETKWPWYSYIAPLSFLIIDDVEEGRSHLNFSEWNRYDGSQKQKLLEEVIEEIEKEEMPLTTYTFTHPNAKLDPYRISILKDWVKPGSNLEKSLMNDTRREKK